jgi:hypothetical protein
VKAKRSPKGIRKVCSRGHVYSKSSDCPVCPTCRPGFYRNKMQSGFPEKLAAPALRALLTAKITDLERLSTFTEEEIFELHGMGPKAMGKLQGALKKNGLSFRKQRD